MTERVERVETLGGLAARLGCTIEPPPGITEEWLADCHVEPVAPGMWRLADFSESFIAHRRENRLVVRGERS